MKRVVFIIALLIFGGCSNSNTQEESNQSQSPPPPKEIKITKNAIKTETNSSTTKAEDGGKFYYSYNKKGNEKLKEYEEKTNKTRTTLDAYLNIKSPYEKVRITLMIKRLSQDYIIKCSPCHDDYANGVIGPSLLDKDGEFIYQRIMDFKTGNRKNVLMRELVSKIDNEKLRAIAQEIANFNREIRKMRMGK
ncbi:MAG: hypothetical protein GXN91_05640 [Epsilonproteobacteria bacterium]|nr:hypothetical protein [Campylobacterota bacterium]